MKVVNMEKEVTKAPTAGDFNLDSPIGTYDEEGVERD